MTPASPLDFLLQALAGGTVSDAIPPTMAPSPANAGFGAILDSVLEDVADAPADGWPDGDGFPVPPAASPAGFVEPAADPVAVAPTLSAVPDPGNAPNPAPGPVTPPVPVAADPDPLALAPSAEPLPGAVPGTSTLPAGERPVEGSPPLVAIPPPADPAVAPAPPASAIAVPTRDGTPAAPPADGLGVEIETAAPTVAVAARVVPAADLARVRVRTVTADPVASPAARVSALAREFGRRNHIQGARAGDWPPQLLRSEGAAVPDANPELPAPATSPSTRPEPAPPAATLPPPAPEAAPPLPTAPVSPAPLAVSPEIAVTPPASLQREILGQVAASITATAKDALVASAGRAEATVHINPPQFGEVKVQVQVDPQQRVHISVEVMEDAALEVLEAEADDLLDTLRGQRLDVADFSVRGDSAGRAAPERGFSDPSPTPDRERRSAPDPEDRPDRSPRRRQAREGGVDTQA